MKVMIIHNSYKHAGGEDICVQNEYNLLSKYGNEVYLYNVSNIKIKNLIKTFTTAINSVYSVNTRMEVDKEIKKFKPNVVHVHNFFPLLTPSIYDACADYNIPVVQTLHNYRIICPNALLMRSGHVCEICIKGSPYHSVSYGCYRSSRVSSFFVARMVRYHRQNHTWRNKVDRFIALTDFAKSKFAIAGVPTQKIVVKPNFYPHFIVPTTVNNHARDGVLFLGRLSKEKGVETMLKAWSGVDTPLRVAGDGPLLTKVQKCMNAKITTLGRINGAQVSDELLRAAFMVLPSECYENFPLTIVEAFAHNVPVVASRLGAMAEIVEDGVTGLHFTPGDTFDLITKINWLSEHPEECRRMGENARKEYEAKYTPEINYQQLLKIYQDAIEEKHKKVSYDR